MKLSTKLRVLAGGALVAAAVAVSLGTGTSDAARRDPTPGGWRDLLRAVIDVCYDDGAPNGRCQFTDPDPFRDTEAFSTRGYFSARGDLYLTVPDEVPPGTYYAACTGRKQTAVVATVRVSSNGEAWVTPVLGHNRPAYGLRRVECTVYDRGVLGD